MIAVLSKAVQPVTGRSIRWQLALASGLMLFVELALIKWLGENILFLSYFSNFVLLGSFLGIGLGFLHAGRGRAALLPWMPVALAILVGVTLLVPIHVSVPAGSFILVGVSVSGGPAWLVLSIVFLATTVIMGMIGDGVARLFRQFPPLEAYRLDIMGSLAGITLFSVLALLEAPSFAWGLVVAVATAALLRRKLKVLGWVGLIALVVILGREDLTPGVSWSPYYKIGTFPAVTHGYSTPVIYVDGLPHQGINPVAEIEKFGPSAYLQPYAEMAIPPKSVLVIGAGNGKDVAIALAMGAQHVTAVEIDPALEQLGVNLNPDHPYQNPRVSVDIGDGRAFLEQNTQKFDLIILAQTDSITVVSGQSSLRLESYLFTEEAIDSVRRHLTSNGVFAAYNFYWEPWYVDRLANTMHIAFGTQPCVDAEDVAGTLDSLTIGMHSSDVNCSHPWVAQSGSLPAPVTDEYPFGYLETPGIPPLYLITFSLVLLASLLSVRLVGGPLRALFKYTDFFFMGAAFLLLETKSVVEFALLFGTTWFVNAFVFAGVLVSVLLGIEISRKFVVRRYWLLYTLLFASLLLAWLVPEDSLLGFSFWPRLILGVAVSFAPVTIANVIFAQRFRQVGDSIPAFASNLVGAIVGGVLEYVAMLTGYRALVIVVAVLYLLAFTSRRLGARIPLLSRAI
jgi:hypothetical protein